MSSQPNYIDPYATLGVKDPRVEGTNYIEKVFDYFFGSPSAGEFKRNLQQELERGGTVSQSQLRSLQALEEKEGMPVTQFPDEPPRATESTEPALSNIESLTQQFVDQQGRLRRRQASGELTPEYSAYEMAAAERDRAARAAPIRGAYVTDPRTGEPIAAGSKEHGELMMAKAFADKVGARGTSARSAMMNLYDSAQQDKQQSTKMNLALLASVLPSEQLQQLGGPGLTAIASNPTLTNKLVEQSLKGTEPATPAQMGQAAEFIQKNRPDIKFDEKTGIAYIEDKGLGFWPFDNKKLPLTGNLLSIPYVQDFLRSKQTRAGGAGNPYAGMEVLNTRS